MRAVLVTVLLQVLLVLSLTNPGAAQGDRTLDIGALTAQADAGNADAQNLLGALYQSGGVVRRDLAEAARWYGKAADQGHPAAQANLAGLYEGGQVAAPSRERWIELLTQSAAQGDPMGMARLGKAYLGGGSFPQDVGQGTRLLMQAVDLHVGFAAYELGRAYLHGIGLPKDADQARAWFLRSSEMGYPPGVYLHARDYEADPDRKFALLRKAAEAGHARAQYDLGSYYRVENSPLYDREAAIYWFTQAALNGNEMGNQALFGLGLPDVNGNDPVNWEIAKPREATVPRDSHSTVLGLVAALGITVVAIELLSGGGPSGAADPQKPHCLPCNWGEVESSGNMCFNRDTGFERPRTCY